MAKLPFVGRVFFKVFAGVLVLLAAYLVLTRWMTGELPVRDIVGSSISAILLAYLVHLWLIPGEEPPDDTRDASGDS
jgi:hypothetical protein